MQSLPFERLGVGLAGFIFLCLASWQATLGFGLDTDAWLMAQTAEKLRMGMPYDPARSLGNPVYELWLTVFQWRENWLVSNFINILIFFYLVFKIPSYFDLPDSQKAASVRILWLLFPLFIKNAASSLEFVPGFWFLLETISSIKKGRTQKAIFWTILAIFTRLEWWPLLLISQMPFWQKNRVSALLLTHLWAIYIAWAWDVNPKPFSDATSFLKFYTQRFGLLLATGGYAFAILAMALIRWKATFSPSGWRWVAILNLSFFLIFPFEWEYALPFFGISLVAIGSSVSIFRAWLLGLILLFSSFIQLKIKNLKNFEFEIKIATPIEDRENQMNAYLWAQHCQPAKPTLFLEGATLFPYPVAHWEKVLENKIFKRKNSLFFVGERLSDNVLDSLRQSGWKIESQLPHSAFRPPKNNCTP